MSSPSRQTYHELSAITRLRAEESGCSARVHRQYDLYTSGEKYYFQLVGPGGSAQFYFTSAQFEAPTGLEDFTKALREAIGAITPSSEAVGI